MVDKQLLITKLINGNGNYITAAALAEEFLVSTKTIRKAIMSLNDELKRGGAAIISKPNRGYCLAINDFAKFSNYLVDKNEEEGCAGYFDKDCQHILTSFFLAEGYIKLDDLADELSLSRSSLQTRLHQVKRTLQKYAVQLSSKPRYGLLLVGNELDIRRCIFDSVPPELLFPRNDYQEKCAEINGILSKAIENHGISLSIDSFEELCRRLLVSFSRWKIGKFIFLTPEHSKYFTIEQPEYAAALEIRYELQEDFGLSIPESETWYLATLLMGLKVYDSAYLSQCDKSAIRQLNIEIESLLHRIDGQFGTAFACNRDLRTSLLLHILPLMSRITFQIRRVNPLKDYIKANQPLSYQIAVLFSNELGKELGVTVDDDEVSYIALHFSLALQSPPEIKHGKRVLVICPSGYTMAKLIASKIYNWFPAWISEIETDCLSKLSHGRCSEFDVVISLSNTSLDFEDNVIRISYPMTGQDIINIRNAIMGTDEENKLLDFIDERLFFRSVRGKDMESALRAICDLIPADFMPPAWLYQSLLERERVSPTDVSGIAAIPHTMRCDFLKSFVSVAILDEPIPWGKSLVRIVFLFCINTARVGRLDNLYKDLVNLLEDEAALRNIIKSGSYNTLAAYLTEGSNENDNIIKNQR